MLILFTGLFAGCEFVFISDTQPIKISGYVTFEGTPIVDAKISSDFLSYTLTNQQGYYEFTTRNKSLTFFAKKPGYNFTPKTYDISTNQTSYDFEAEKATQLNGTLSLTQILISPTSIVAIPRNNFDYKTGTTSNLKIAEFKFGIGQDSPQSITFTPSDRVLFEKYVFTDILNLQQIQVEPLAIAEDGRVNTRFIFMLKAYYQDGNGEQASTEITSIFEANSKLDTGDLDENGNIKFSAASINSFSKSFTYNIQFIFKYQQAG